MKKLYDDDSTFLVMSNVDGSAWTTEVASSKAAAAGAFERLKKSGAQSVMICAVVKIYNREK